MTRALRPYRQVEQAVSGVGNQENAHGNRDYVKMSAAAKWPLADAAEKPWGARLGAELVSRASEPISELPLASEPRSGPVTISVLGDPVAIGRPRFTRGGIAYTPGKTRATLAALQYAAQQEMAGREPFEGPLKVVALFEVRMPKTSRRRTLAMISGDTKPDKRPDLDNFLKALDALNGVVWRDDAQIVELHAEKRYGAQPKVVITVSPLPAAAAVSPSAASR